MVASSRCVATASAAYVVPCDADASPRGDDEPAAAFHVARDHVLSPPGSRPHHALSFDPPVGTTKPATTTKPAITRRASIGLGKPPALCTLSWSNLSYTVANGRAADSNNKKAILKGVSGRCAAGELTAVMGPSGCGKTTLLDLLADRVSTGAVEGEIHVNGAPRTAKHFRAVARYVAQEDALLGCFTVKETLRMAAQLTLPRATTSREGADALVDRVLVEMGLHGCENTYVGDVFHKGISGGQKRRLSIAIELLSNPSILLLDEPTSGLDSCATYNVMKLLAQLCQQGRTVVCTIHQPSSLVFDAFSNVAILAKGETVYFGARAALIPHFTSAGYACPRYSNVSEHYVGLVNADFEGHGDIARLCGAYAGSTLAAELAHKIAAEREAAAAAGAASGGKSPSTTLGKLGRAARGRDNDGAATTAVSLWQQTAVLLYRNSVRNVRNPGIFAVRLVMYVVLAVCIGTMYLSTNDRLAADDIVVLLFGVHAFFVFNSVAVVPFFIQERAVFLRERGNSGLRVDSFVVANFVAGLPGLFVISLAASVLVVALAGLKSFGLYVVNMFLSLVVAESLMHVIGAVATDGIIGIAIGASLFGMFMLCEGFMVPKDAIPGYWIWVHYLGFLTYGFEAFIHTQFLADATQALPLAVQRLGLGAVSYTDNMLILLGYALGLELVFAAIIYKFHTGRR